MVNRLFPVEKERGLGTIKSIGQFSSKGSRAVGRELDPNQGTDERNSVKFTNY